MTQTPKDFIALSHGKEWVSFYESFDKLVQDNLSRSSDLLRRAMSLPEVADREVQQIRSEMETKLATERGNQRAMLEALKDDLGGSQHLVSTLARSLGAVIGDLERLSQRVETAIVGLTEDASPVGPEQPALVALNGTASNGVHATYASSVEIPAAAQPVEFQATPAPESAPEAPIEAIVPFEFSELPVDALAEAEEPVAGAEPATEDPDDSIDLTALAEAEVTDTNLEDPIQFEQEPNGSAENGIAGEARARPHWLSVTRGGART